MTPDLVVLSSEEQRVPARRSHLRNIPNYIPTLDGWRALAIISVICFHGRYVFFPHPSFVRSISDYGYLGVDAFFAISGFLICDRLLQEFHNQGSINIRKFYLQRCFRILPPYLVAMAGIALGASLGFIHLNRWELPSCLLFYRNYKPTVAPPGGPYDPYGFYTSHFWSLAVEEHFYLIWAPLLAFLNPLRAIQAAFALAIAVCIWRTIDGHFRIMETLLPGAAMGTRTDSRLDALLWGCLTALFFPQLKRIFSHRRWALAWFPLCAYLVFLEKYHPPLFHLQSALVFPALLMSTVLFPGSLLGRLLELPAVRWIGVLSYSMYLWQQLFFQPPRDAYSPEKLSGFYHVQQWPWNVLVLMLFAVASYYLLERPMIRFGRRLSKRSWAPITPGGPELAKSSSGATQRWA